MSFTGEFRHTVDAKGRLTLPSRMRGAIPGDNVVLTKWMEGCIAVWTTEAFTQMQESLRTLPRGAQAARGLNRWFNAGAHPDDVDKQGRITIPQQLRDFAGVERDVVVIGNDDHAEIWDPARWDEQQSAVDDDRVAELAEQLNF